MSSIGQFPNIPRPVPEGTTVTQPYGKVKTSEERAKQQRQKATYLANKAQRARYNTRLQQGDNPPPGDAAPWGLNKLGAGNKKTSGKKAGGVPHFRGRQYHESKSS